MFEKDNNNPFEKECPNCISDIWEIINAKKISEEFFIPSTKIKIEKFDED